MKGAAVRNSRVAGRALAALGHRVADRHGTPFNVCHLIGPVAVTHSLLGQVMVAHVDRILIPAHTEKQHVAKKNMHADATGAVLFINRSF